MHLLLQATASGTAGEAPEATYRRMKSAGRQAVTSKLSKTWPRSKTGRVPMLCRPSEIKDKDQQAILQSIWNWAVAEGIYAALRKENLSSWEDLVGKWGATRASDLLDYLSKQKTKYAPHADC